MWREEECLHQTNETCWELVFSLASISFNLDIIILYIILLSPPAGSLWRGGSFTSRTRKKNKVKINSVMSQQQRFWAAGIWSGGKSKKFGLISEFIWREQMLTTADAKEHSDLLCLKRPTATTSNPTRWKYCVSVGPYKVNNSPLRNKSVIDISPASACRSIICRKDAVFGR